MNTVPTKKRVGPLVAAGAAIGTLVLAATTAFASGAATPPRPHFQRPAVFGVVSGVSGSTVRVAARDGTTYDVDVSGATLVRGFWKSTTTIAVADIKDGDRVVAFGNVSGTSVAATKLVDGPAAGEGHVHSRGDGRARHAERMVRLGR